MKVMKKMLSIIISVVMIVVLAGIYLPTRVSAGVQKEVVFNGDVTLYDGETILITSGITQDGTITIADGATVNLEIRDLTIYNPILLSKDNPCIKLGSKSILNLTISGNNNLTANGVNSPAIDTSDGTLKINGSGSLTAKARDNGAGIGGGVSGSGGNIDISGGSITATSQYGAGIGESFDGSGGNIDISGGSITATSQYGAGIGGGNYGYGGKIIISKGSIKASSELGAGIGGGINVSGGNIDISGGSIKASSQKGAGIGGGVNGSGGNIDISGGSIVASSALGSDIGNGLQGKGVKTKITGGSVDANNVDSPTNDGVTAIGKKTVTLGGSGEAVGGLFFTQAYTYGFTDVVSDSNNKIYIWLPVNLGVKTIGDEFPDNRIANRVVDQINKNPNTGNNNKLDSVLTKEMALSVKDLDLSSLALKNTDTNTETSLEDLNILTSLVNLNLNDNQLTSLPDMSKLTSLKELNISKNQFKKVPDISELTDLQNLDLSNNPLISPLDMSGLKNLKELNLTYNSLETLPDISGLIDLQNLNLSHNNISIQGNTGNSRSLKTLDLSNNQITSALDMSKLTSLQLLDVSNNKITSLPDINKLTSLQTLKLNNNQLISLPDISKLGKLSVLWADNNQLTDIQGLSQAKNLNNVELSGQVYSGIAKNTSIGESEEVEIPIVKEIIDEHFGDYKDYTYSLQVNNGVEKDISNDIKVDDRGVTIPGKDIVFIGNYKLHIVGLSGVSNAGVTAEYSGDYTYTFAVGSAPVPTPKGGSGIIVPSTSTSKTLRSNKTNKGLSSLTNTGLSKEMYVGIIMIVLGTGALVFRRKKD